MSKSAHCAGLSEIPFDEYEAVMYPGEALMQKDGVVYLIESIEDDRAILRRDDDDSRHEMVDGVIRPLTTD